jgi:ATP-dependent helicase/nuclease subunit B
MLKVVTGRFHPSLEAALVEHIQRIKENDPWAKVAIVVPSKPILDRIRRLVAIEHRLSWLNIYLLTFHQLGLRLADELRGRTPLPWPRIVDELFFEQLARHLVERRRPKSQALGQLGQSFGTWSALWATLRDLEDGGVDPNTALQALGEGCFGQENMPWLHDLFSLQADMQNVCEELKVGTADGLTKSLVSGAAASAFLASLSHICYYGFYDLTQVQLSLLQAVTGSAPTTLFFPLEDEPSFAFARRFFDRHIQPLLGSDPPVDLSERKPAPPQVELSIQSVIGPEEELAVTCRTILDLVETHGYRFNEIGVVARTLDPYCTALRTMFDRHRIPFATTARRPLIQHPLSKVVLLLATLPLHDFYRAAVLDVISSPFYVKGGRGRESLSTDYRPEQWRAVVEALHITHGLDEWKRLERFSRSALDVDGGGEDIGALGPFKVAPAVVGFLWDAVSELLASCAALPAKSSIQPLLHAFERLMEHRLHRTDDESGRHGPPLIEVWQTIDQALASLADVHLLGQDLTWAQFAELMTHAFEQASVPLDSTGRQGVMVTDAMAARGLPFKALFVLGLNEKVFPRYIREDPFLRDRDRRVLETTLGYKVDEKLPGYDEEALLFTLLTQAAGRRLYLSFQRADQNGRVLAPSPYVGEAGHRLGIAAPPPHVIPRRLSELIAQRPTISRFVPPAALAQWMAFIGKDPIDLLRATGAEAEVFHHGLEALNRIEDDQPELNAFDGMTGPVEQHWAVVLDRGIAPTPLERYARCPFRYFAADVLRLVPVRPTASDGPDARMLGTFCHGAMRRCYEQLLPTGWPAKPVTDDTIDWCIDTAVGEAADEVERQYETGHYLLWELAKASIADVMTAAIDDEARAFHDAPFTPVAFELMAEGTIADVSGHEEFPLKIRGRIDRLDQHRESGALRIIDYKLKMGNTMAPEDRHLLQSALRGYRLQPPLYTQLWIPNYGTARQVQFFFLAPAWSSPATRSTFEADHWSGTTGAQLRTTLGRLIAGIRHGRFFIMPDSAYCPTCEYRIACRREHQPTWWRASRAGESRDLSALRSQQVIR